jgi:hypothetical protein
VPFLIKLAVFLVLLLAPPHIAKAQRNGIGQRQLRPRTNRNLLQAIIRPPVAIRPRLARLGGEQAQTRAIWHRESSPRLQIFRSPRSKTIYSHLQFAPSAEPV